jgi:hypothetical protein
MCRDKIISDLLILSRPSSRYYLKNSTSIETLLPLEAKQDLVANLQSGVLQIHVPTAARLMAQRDHELFSSIEPLEYMSFLWKEPGRGTANLQAFTDRFNQVCDWVATEVCIYSRHPPPPPLFSKEMLCELIPCRFAASPPSASGLLCWSFSSALRAAVWTCGISTPCLRSFLVWAAPRSRV